MKVILTNEVLNALIENEGLVAENTTIKVNEKGGRTILSLSSANKAGEVYAASFIVQAPPEEEIKETGTTVNTKLFFGHLKAVTGIEGPFTIYLPDGAGTGTLTGKSVNIKDIPFLPYTCVKNMTNGKAGLFFRVKGKVLSACLSRISGCGHVYVKVVSPDEIVLTGTYETAQSSGGAGAISAMMTERMPVVKAAAKDAEYEPYLSGDCQKDGKYFGTAFSREAVSRLRSLKTNEEDEVMLVLTDKLCTVKTASRMVEVLTLSGSLDSANKMTSQIDNIAAILKENLAATLMIDAGVYEGALATMHALSDVCTMQGKKDLARFLDFSPLDGGKFRMAIAGSEVTPPALKVSVKDGGLPAGIPCFALPLIEKTFRALGAPAAVAVSLSLSPDKKAYMACLLPMRTVRKEVVNEDGSHEEVEKTVLDDKLQVFLAGMSRAAMQTEAPKEEEKAEEEGLDEAV